MIIWTHTHCLCSRMMKEFNEKSCDPTAHSQKKDTHRIWTLAQRAIMCIKKGTSTLPNVHDVMSVILCSGLKVSDGSRGWFPWSHCLRNMACYFLACSLYYYLNDYIRFRQLSADADRHLGLQFAAAKSHHGIHPKAYLSSCFACLGFL